LSINLFMLPQSPHYTPFCHRQIFPFLCFFENHKAASSVSGSKKHNEQLKMLSSQASARNSLRSDCLTKLFLCCRKKITCVQKLFLLCQIIFSQFCKFLFWSKRILERNLFLRIVGYALEIPFSFVHSLFLHSCSLCIYNER
jgi:hypothetical protein